MEPIISRIVGLMSERNVTATKLTDDIGMSHTAITDWKKGRGTPKVKAIADIAKYFGVSTDYLITGHESQSYVIPFATNTDKVLIQKFNALPYDIQQEVLQFIDFKVAQTIRDNAKKLG